ncbi:hypothetical protein Pcinc_022071 [Petrolisthes cinctipes]|uniref:Uncharacterized protein n=1 Tax=Petrolisthes cinctipes TaxID=88211 RepID=A0AAE1KGJ9_PETCI|nr:hypothetical protein Pcinc_022071 [Petrolisthes cinctipes]
MAWLKSEGERERWSWEEKRSSFEVPRSIGFDEEYDEHDHYHPQARPLQRLLCYPSRKFGGSALSFGV